MVTQARNSAQGLDALGSVKLSKRNENLLAQAAAACHGSAIWRGRKMTEGRELLALSQIAPKGRLIVNELDLREALRALVVMKCPVPCRPGENGKLVVADRAVLGITYRQEALFEALPGYVFVQIQLPQSVWHANVFMDPIQPLCLGVTLPPGIRIREIVLLAYGALSGQSIQMDERNAAGVMNTEAARWWQQNMSLLPLSKIPFLEPDNRRKE